MSIRIRRYSAMMPIAAGLSLLGLGVTAISPTPAGAQNLYYSGVGYDMSYAQCSVKGVPTDLNHPVTFAIIGVGGGRPFTANTCAPSQWRYAGSQNQQRSLYFNTGYALAYAKSETSDCATASTQQSFPGSTKHQLSALQTAWAIGCSESDYAMALAPGTPVAWWADIETANSWSNNLSLNQATIDGIVTELAQKSPTTPIGVYSSPSMWQQIVGVGYVNPSIVADWQAGTTCPSPNSSTGQIDGFSLTSSTTPAPLWLAQSGSWSAYYTTFDKDTAC